MKFKRETKYCKKLLCSGDIMEEICKLKHEQRTIRKKKMKIIKNK